MIKRSVGSSHGGVSEFNAMPKPGEATQSPMLSVNVSFSAHPLSSAGRRFGVCYMVGCINSSSPTSETCGPMAPMGSVFPRGLDGTPLLPGSRFACLGCSSGNVTVLSGHILHKAGSHRSLQFCLPSPLGSMLVGLLCLLLCSLFGVAICSS